VADLDRTGSDPAERVRHRSGKDDAQGREDEDRADHQPDSVEPNLPCWTERLRLVDLGDQRHLMVGKPPVRPHHGHPAEVGVPGRAGGSGESPRNPFASGQTLQGESLFGAGLGDEEAEPIDEIQLPRFVRVVCKRHDLVERSKVDATDQNGDARLSRIRDRCPHVERQPFECRGEADLPEVRLVNRLEEVGLSDPDRPHLPILRGDENPSRPGCDDRERLEQPFGPQMRKKVRGHEFGRHARISGNLPRLLGDDVGRQVNDQRALGDALDHLLDVANPTKVVLFPRLDDRREVVLQFVLDGPLGVHDRHVGDERHRERAKNEERNRQSNRLPHGALR